MLRTALLITLYTGDTSKIDSAVIMRLILLGRMKLHWFFEAYHAATSNASHVLKT